MHLPIFITDNWISVLLNQKEPTDKITDTSLIKLVPEIDPFNPKISKEKLDKILASVGIKELDSANFVVISGTDDTGDLSVDYILKDFLEHISIPLIVPEVYYDKALDLLPPSSANHFLNNLKYGFDIPEDLRILMDSSAINLYVKENIGKFIGQTDIINSVADLHDDFIKEYTEAMVKAVSDSLQIAGMWKIHVDKSYALIPNLINLFVMETDYEPMLEKFMEVAEGKLIIAPGVIEIEAGENGNFETIKMDDVRLNKFKIKPDDKITLRWKSQKSRFEGEIFGSLTGIKIDVRERSK